MSRFTISDVMQETGLSKRTIHYYIGRGLIPPAFRDEEGFFYTEEHVTKIRYVRWLAEKHVSLQAVAFQMQGKTCEALNADMRAGGAEQGLQLDVVRTPESPAVYLRVDLQPGLELHMSEAVYQRLRYKIDAMSAYAKKLISEE